jgi:hypothetical protein
MTWPRDSVRLAHFQGSTHGYKSTFITIAHQQVESFDVQTSILDIFPLGIRPQILTERLLAELPIKVQIDLFGSQRMHI